MKKVRMIILILIIILIAIIFILLIAINKNKKNSSSEPSAENDMKEVYEGGIAPVTESNKFYTIENCINKYLSYANLDIEKQSDEETNQPSLAMIYNIITEEEKKQAIYNVLDKDFISENSITIDNIYNYIEHSNKEFNFEAVKMNKLSDTTIDVEGYSVYGKLKGLYEEKISYQYFIVKIDTYRNTFCIYPLKSQEYNDINDITVQNSTIQIEENERNTFANIDIPEGQIARIYFQNYKNLMIENPEEAYELLDEEYRQKRFGSIDNYKKYVEQNEQFLRTIAANKYNMSREKEYIQYICIDQYDNYYIFRETATMQFSVILDTYTIDLPEFVEKYNEANEAEKVVLNINKFIQSINSQDYKYAYNCLSEGFRKNSFKDIDIFKEYVTKNFYSSNEIKYTQFRNEGTTFIYDIEIIDKTGKNTKPIEKSIIMQLEDGTDFVMSFNV